MNIGTGQPGEISASRTPFEMIGGDEPTRQLAKVFYDIMESDPDFKMIRDLHPDDMTSSRDKFTDFLIGWLGGPPLYMQKHGHPRLRMRHAPFPIGTAERDQWLACMGRAMDKCAITGELRAFLDARFAHVADFMRNQPG